MSACPFCQTPMQATFRDGLSRDECAACGALWLEGEFLPRVLGAMSLEALAQEAKGKPGRCKGCETELRYVPGCPSCGRRAPTCPHCGDAPLPVVKVRGVAVDFCAKCGGIALDAGELPRLRGPVGTRASEPRRDEGPALNPLDLHPKVKLGSVPTCTRCQRKLKPKYGFVWEERLYCGSCAPEGSTPFSDELTKATPSEISSFPSEHGGMNLNAGPGETMLARLLSKLFG